MIGSISYRLFVKEIHATPYFVDGHYAIREHAIIDARALIEGNHDIEWVNIYCQEHVKRFERPAIVETGS